MLSVSRARVFEVASLNMLALAAGFASAQTTARSSSDANTTTLTARSNLVLVPALVTARNGEVVFSLTADDFVLADNGVPQKLRLEPDSDMQPVAMVMVLQTGGLGTSHLEEYSGAAAQLDAVIGNVPHRIAVVSFDSVPRLEQDFTSADEAPAKAISRLNAGDSGAAVLDALNFGIGLLRKQPPQYRRVLLLFSETIDRGSQSTLQGALRAIDDTNTAIYSFGFSSGRAAVAHEASKLPRPGGSEYSSQPYAPGGCMSRDAGADPDAHGNRGVQALDCASDLIPVLRLPRMAYIAASDGLKRNVPESVARLTGGEYFSLKNSKTLTRDLMQISNDLPNYYLLSFSPQSPEPGFHALELKLKDRPNLDLRARNAYWIDEDSVGAKK